MNNNLTNAPVVIQNRFIPYIPSSKTLNLSIIVAGVCYCFMHYISAKYDRDTTFQCGSLTYRSNSPRNNNTSIINV